MNKSRSMSAVLLPLILALLSGCAATGPAVSTSMPTRITSTCVFDNEKGSSLETCISELEDDGYQVIDVIFRPIVPFDNNLPRVTLNPYVSSRSGVVIGEIVTYSQ